MTPWVAVGAVVEAVLILHCKSNPKSLTFLILVNLATHCKSRRPMSMKPLSSSPQIQNLWEKNDLQMKLIASTLLY